MLPLLRIAVVLVSPGVGSSAVSRSDILSALELATRDTGVKLIEMDPGVIDRCAGLPRCISRERPPEVSHLLIVTHAVEEEMQDRLTVQVLGKSVESPMLEHWIDDPDQLIAFWRMLIAQELEPDNVGAEPVSSFVATGGPLKPYERERNGVAWSSAIVATGGFAMLVYAIFGPDSDDELCLTIADFCQIAERREVFGVAQSIGYGVIAGGITSAIAAFVSSDDHAPWWQPVVGMVVAGATIGLTLLLDRDDPRRHVFGLALESR